MKHILLFLPVILRAISTALETTGFFRSKRHVTVWQHPEQKLYQTIIIYYGKNIETQKDYSLVIERKGHAAVVTLHAGCSEIDNVTGILNNKGLNLFKIILGHEGDKKMSPVRLFMEIEVNSFIFNDGDHAGTHAFIHGLNAFGAAGLIAKEFYKQKSFYNFNKTYFKDDAGIIPAPNLIGELIKESFIVTEKV